MRRVLICLFAFVAVLVFSTCSDDKDVSSSSTLEGINDLIGNTYWEEVECKVVDKNGVARLFSEVEAEGLLGEGRFRLYLFSLNDVCFKIFFKTYAWFCVNMTIDGCHNNTLFLSDTFYSDIKLVSISSDRVDLVYWMDKALYDVETGEWQKGSYVKASYKRASEENINNCISAIDFATKK